MFIRTRTCTRHGDRYRSQLAGKNMQRLSLFVDSAPPALIYINANFDTRITTLLDGINARPFKFPFFRFIRIVEGVPRITIAKCSIVFASSVGCFTERTSIAYFRMSADIRTLNDRSCAGRSHANLSMKHITTKAARLFTKVPSQRREIVVHANARLLIAHQLIALFYRGLMAFPVVVKAETREREGERQAETERERERCRTT